MKLDPKGLYYIGSFFFPIRAPLRSGVHHASATLGCNINQNAVEKFQSYDAPNHPKAVANQVYTCHKFGNK